MYGYEDIRNIYIYTNTKLRNRNYVKNENWKHSQKNLRLKLHNLSLLDV